MVQVSPCRPFLYVFHSTDARKAILGYLSSKTEIQNLCDISLTGAKPHWDTAQQHNLMYYLLVN